MNTVYWAVIALAFLVSTSLQAGFGIGKKSPRRWPGGIVPYEFAPDVDARARQFTVQAMQEWSDRTGGTVHFVTRTREADYVLVQPSPECLNRSPSIGRAGGKQDLFLGTTGCGLALPLVEHELGHAIGLMHEHQRPDRDQFIVVHEENHAVVPGREQQSAAQIAIIPEHSNPEYDATKYGAYDLSANAQSIMHYGSFVSSNGDGPVMERKGGGVIPNPQGISPTDVRAIQEMYSVATQGASDPTLTLAERIGRIAVPLVSPSPTRGKALGLMIAITDGTTRRYFSFGSIREGDREPKSTDLWEIGSNTKVFTSLALAALANRAPHAEAFYKKRVVELLPELGTLLRSADAVDGERKATITLEQLATHTSGLTSEIPAEIMPRETNDYALFLRAIARMPLRFAPGTRYEYCNSGMSLLGKALSQFAGKPFADLVTEHVLSPLKLTSTGFSPTGVRAQGYLAQLVDGVPTRIPTSTVVGLVNQPTGGLLSTSENMLAFLEALRSPPANTAGAAIRQIVPIRRTYSCFDDRTCGIGLGLEGLQEGELQWLHVKTGQTSAFSSVIAYRDAEAGVFIVGNDRDLDLMPVAKRVLDAVALDARLKKRDALSAQAESLEERYRQLMAQAQQMRANAEYHRNNAAIHDAWLRNFQALVEQQKAAVEWCLAMSNWHVQFMYLAAYYQNWAAYQSHLSLVYAYLALARQVINGPLAYYVQSARDSMARRTAEITAAQNFRQAMETLLAEAERVKAQRQAIADQLRELAAL